MLRGPASTATLRGLLDETTAPEARVQLTAALAHGLYVQGRWADALAALDRAERTGAADAAWAPLFQGLRATIHHGAGHSERCAVLARQVIADARSGRHPFGEAYGRHALSCALLRDRRTEAALAENTLALRAAARVDRTGARWLTCTLTDLRVTMLLYRAVMLGLVDRPEEARSALDRARDETAGRATADQLGGITVTAALLDYTTGRWDDALARLDRQPDPVDPWLPSLRHSVAALVHGHRDRGADARAHCEAAAGRTTPCGSHSNRGGYPLMAARCWRSGPAARTRRWRSCSPPSTPATPATWTSASSGCPTSCGSPCAPGTGPPRAPPPSSAPGRPTANTTRRGPPPPHAAGGSWTPTPARSPRPSPTTAGSPARSTSARPWRTARPSGPRSANRRRPGNCCNRPWNGTRGSARPGTPGAPSGGCGPWASVRAPGPPGTDARPPAGPPSPPPS
ncbi:hypothetical protein I3J08_00805 [Streptomyces clavuligerus]|uniref:hypothetical protein n=1 Tax=Streptomyces clavuligerus TaxID=1901 RepID=UPI0018CA10F7|nr:hypothetical protein [Streptomyces clavuligerus]QPL91120.1 hypothetical protein I3J08_00805 [Streptomyces clavuligerus]